MQNLTSVSTVLIDPVLITCTLPRKKILSSNTLQTEHVHSVSTQYVLSGDKRGALEDGEDQKSQDQRAFLHNAED
ncbi:unnamed protein product [Staurois parvus]|uniref:Uncharacterized protein n=1 Tax=Staurois parvus TaxID=386267 RepID=A0ABN9F4E1_9NEOB|nr:unnamed protein product [Staurois parvus]